jgi:hypothetical protein
VTAIKNEKMYSKASTSFLCRNLVGNIDIIYHKNPIDNNMGDALTEEIIPLILQRKELNDSAETADSRRIIYNIL